jgi:tetratricopeptide (TPR) repeat protein
VRCGDLLEREVGDLSAEAGVSVPLALLHAMNRNFLEAGRLLERARAIYSELSRTPSLYTACAPAEAKIAELAGDLERAAGVYRQTCEALSAAQPRFHLATQAADFATVLCELGQADEAETWCVVASEHARSDDLEGRIAVGIARARLLAHSGGFGEAEKVANAALELADATDGLNLIAAVHLARADVLADAGRTEDAADALASAGRLYAEKENAAAADRLDRRRAAAAL